MKKIGRNFLKAISLILILVLVLQTVLVAAVAAPTATPEPRSSNFQIVNLKSHYTEAPIGFDVETPVFSWQMESAERGHSQTKYQLKMGTTAGGSDMWDSGTVSSAESVSIPYEGAALAAKTIYYWSVTVWNQSDISKTASSTFETGMMSESDTTWEADWIGNHQYDYDPSAPLSFEVSLNIEIDAGVAALVFGNGTTTYLWQVTTSGGKLFFKPHAGLSAILPAPLELTSFIAAGSELDPHDLKVTYSGTTLTTYIDNAKIDERSLTVAGLDRVGFRAGQNESAFYDDLAVKINGVPAYSNDFSNTSNTDFSGGSFVGGRYKVTYAGGDLQPMHIFQQGSSVTDTADFYIEVDVKVLRDAAGLVFGAKDGSNYYMWQLNVQGNNLRLRPHRWLNGGGAALAQTNINGFKNYLYEADGTTLKDVFNTFKIEVLGGIMKTYILDSASVFQLVDTFDLGKADLSLHKIGFRQNVSGNERENAAYKNLKVYDNVTGSFVFEDNFDGSISNFTAGRIESNQLVFDGTSSVFTLQKDNPLVDAAIYARKEFNTNNTKTIEKARLYITSRGAYEAYIDGQRVGNDYLNPGWTDVNNRILYKTYDVTDLVDSGDNHAIGVIVGSGWFASRSNAYRDYSYPIYGKHKALLAQLEITYSDGTVETVATDSSWAVTQKGPITTSDNWDGEKYDSRKNLGGWSSPSYTQNSAVWSPAIESLSYHGLLQSQLDAPIEEYMEIPAISMVEAKPGVYVYNLGQNIAGVSDISLAQPAGTSMKIRYGEWVYEDGQLYTENLRGAVVTDYYTFDGGAPENYRPRFTFHGFQYIEISGVDTPPPLSDVKGIVFSSNTVANQTGAFDSSNPSINKLYANTYWSQLANFISIPTDCPQRDERQGWTGDAQEFALTSAYNSDVNLFFHKWMYDMQDAQRVDASGNRTGFDNVAPNPSGEFRGMGVVANTGWSDAGVIVPWQMYMQYNSTTIIEENYEAMKAHIDYLHTTYPDHLREQGAYGDWLSPGGRPTEGLFMGIAFYAYITRLFAEMADVVGKTSDADYYYALYEEIYQVFQDRYVNPDGSLSYTIGGKEVKASQTAYSEAIYFELIPEQHLAAAGNQLVQAIEENGGKLSTGFLGARYLVPALSMTGNNETAYKLILNDENPSWLYSVKNGASTIWERWDTFVAEGYQFQSTGMNSFNHYAYGAVVEWMYRYSAGIDRDNENPGFKHIILQPNPSDQFTFGGDNYVTASYDSPYGKITSGWEQLPLFAVDSASYRYTATIPANTTATVYLPTINSDNVFEGGAPIPADGSTGIVFVGIEDGKSVYEIVSGTYEFTFSTDSYKGLVIENPSGVSASVIVDGKTYGLPVNLNARENIEEIEVVSKDSNFAFSHWTGSMAGSQNPLKLSDAQDLRLEANFKFIGSGGSGVLTIGGANGTALVNGKSYLLPMSEQMELGADIVIQVVPDDGYIFTGIDGDFNNLSSTTVVVMDGDVSIAANIEDNTISKNIALHKKASSNSTYTSGNSWGTHLVTDGVTTGTGYTSNGYSTADLTGNPVWLEIDLEHNRTITELILHSRSDRDSINSGQFGFPEDFEIQGRKDGEDNYTTLKTIVGAPDAQQAYTITLDNPSEVRYVRIAATKIRLTPTETVHRMQFAEIEIFNDVNEAYVETINISEVGSTGGTIAKGETISLSANVSPSNAFMGGVKWYVYNETADGYTPDSLLLSAKVEGYNTVFTGLAKGNAIIIASAVDGSGILGTFLVTVGDAPITDVPTVSVSQLSVEVGKTTSFTVSLGQAVSVEVSSSDDSVVTVSPAMLNANGSVSVMGVNEGAANIELSFNFASGSPMVATLGLSGESSDRISPYADFENPITIPVSVTKAGINKSLLATSISKANSLKEADYTTASWANLAAALGDAINIYDDSSAVQADIDSAQQALDAAVKALVKKAVDSNKSLLAASISKAKSLKEADYTTASWANLAVALEDAIDVCEDSSAVQADIDSAQQALDAAVKALVNKDDDGNGEVPGTSGLVVQQGSGRKDSVGTSRADVSPNLPQNATSTPAPKGIALTKEQAKKAITQAVANAKANNQTTVTLKLVNCGLIEQSTFAELYNGAEGMQVTIHNDNLSSNGKTVDVRVSLKLSGNSSIMGNMNLFASTNSIAALKVRALFQKTFANNLIVIESSHTGKFSVPVEMAVKLPESMKHDSLVLYSYDPVGNLYVQLAGANPWTDANGFVHFSTSTGGLIILSDGPLVKK